ncbi:MAG: hypothetical protein D3913_07290 [Candidatus Electrothrix sp. LOE1_4_5]|nr:hypothetical protein [Candidatus Electrothrix gigas]
MKVIYYSRTRNYEFEKKGVIFKEKQELLKESDIISLQTPKNIKILEKEDFDLMNKKVFINNTLGKAFDKDDFRKWIEKPSNFTLMDMVSDFGNEFQKLDRVIYSDIVSGTTNESVIRLNQKIVDNIKSFIEQI